MKRCLLQHLGVFCLFLGSLNIVQAASVCQGRFLNPISDICWSCIFPITLGNTALFNTGTPDTENPSSPICACGDPIPRIGISIGFWEPVRLVDVVREPYCFVNLGGQLLNIGSSVGTGTVASQASGRDSSFYQVHYYIYPVLYWLNLIFDALCLETQGFDIAYLTELDPTWDDDELAFILNPEVVLFANPTAQAACAADCTQSTTYLPNNGLFWCGGCQGSLYPFTGHVQAHVGGVQASQLLAERMLAKLHREGLLWGTYGEQGLCGNYPMPVLKKSQYRLQMTYPIPATTSLLGCNPFGRSTLGFESGREYPMGGEDFGYLIWRKKNCCAL